MSRKHCIVSILQSHDDTNILFVTLNVQSPSELKQSLHGLMVMCYFEGMMLVMTSDRLSPLYKYTGKYYGCRVGVDIVVYQHEGSLYFIFRHIIGHTVSLLSCSKGTRIKYRIVK